MDGDYWCWLMIFLNTNPVRDENGSIICGPLWHPRLVRSFILHGRCQHISMIFFPLCTYIISNSILKYVAITEILSMCHYEQTRSNVIAYITQYGKSTGLAIENVMLESDKRSPSLVLRENVIAVFDLLFPPTPFWVFGCCYICVLLGLQINDISKVLW